MTQSATRGSAIGDLIRQWRRDRNVSQLDLAAEAGVSTRHLSFVETGRSAPSRDMVLRLAEHLDVPLRDRNRLLLAAGYAPAYTETPLDTARLRVVRAAIRRVLDSHDPFPAFAVDACWNLVDANASVALLTRGAPPELLAEPFNVLRYSLHPRGLAARMLNLAQWRKHVLTTVERQLKVGATGNGELAALHRELLAFPDTNQLGESEPDESTDVFVPLRLLHEGVELSFFSTVTTFGTPRDITVDEVHVENFYPADETTEKYLRR
ncbi:transcriptional regulator with XRE-family HTH domain [Actinokineospora baliensis]|uniref:helix-turn-helix domain-containing protein n=1 Tax=Actinokineospora baliensis TaxID=547056 RepID=UPI00195B8A70|nr:helix-turn-helix transcriptional regulator [Actinokineospora baliensis]MBM7774992.1 transcriptional regulator with XRE-family HTH domain [Actinokineospora baliensis]